MPKLIYCLLALLFSLSSPLFGARYYEHNSGRFLRSDPLGHPSSVDLYSYANGDPINSVDPDGRIASDVTSGLLLDLPRNVIGGIADFGWGLRQDSISIFQAGQNDGILMGAFPELGRVLTDAADPYTRLIDSAHHDFFGTLGTGFNNAGNSLIEMGKRDDFYRSLFAGGGLIAADAFFGKGRGTIDDLFAARGTNDLPMGPGAANVDEFGRMGNQTVRISDLTPPASRPFADPAKLQRHGDFDWQKYTPITVDRLPSGRLEIMDGMTRVENARRAGITELPANVYPRR